MSYQAGYVAGWIIYRAAAEISTFFGVKDAQQMEGHAHFPLIDSKPDLVVLHLSSYSIALCTPSKKRDQWIAKLYWKSNGRIEIFGKKM